MRVVTEVNLSNGKVTHDEVQAAAITGAASTIATDDLTSGRALISDSHGKVAVSSVTSTELYRLSGVTGNVQSQLDAKLAASAALSWENVALSDFATAASGWSFVSGGCVIQRNEALGAVRCRLQLTPSANQTAGQKTVATVKAAYRPKTVYGALSSLTSNAQAAQIYTSGGMAAHILAISSGVNLYFNGVYFIGS